MPWSGAIIAWGLTLPNARPLCYPAGKLNEDAKLREVFAGEIWRIRAPKMGRKVYDILSLGY
jgi:hypothetical protein